jgi:hypothetical protein
MAAALLGDEHTGYLALHPCRHHDRIRLGQDLRFVRQFGTRLHQ